MPKSIMIDITGQRFGRLIAIQPIGTNKHKSMQWLCRCDCGKSSTVVGFKLRNGHTKSCGCRIGIGQYKHGHATRKTKHPLYVTWQSMHDRCRRPNAPEYKNYGARGIYVCERWKDFENFITDVGERPVGHTLDRIDVNGPYMPNNIRWATPKESIRNRRPLRTRLAQYSTAELEAELARRR